MFTYFNLSDISKYRSALMGVSILLIMFFHCGLIPNGHIGVEFFLFISAIGLYFSLSKNPDTPQFYKRRLVRILPTYFVLTIPYVLVYKHFHPEEPLVELVKILFQIRTLTESMDFSQWFISLILICYLFTPLFFKNHRILLSYPFLIVFTVLCFSCSHLFTPSYIIDRLPVFFWSLKVADGIYAKKQIHYLPVFALLLTAILFWIFIMPAAGTYYPQFGAKVFAFLLATLPLIILITAVVSRLPQRVIHVLDFFGSISLELYLSHECIKYVLAKYIVDGEVWSKAEILEIAFISMLLAIAVAYVTHKVIAHCTQHITRKS